MVGWIEARWDEDPAKMNRPYCFGWIYVPAPDGPWKVRTPTHAPAFWSGVCESLIFTHILLAEQVSKSNSGISLLPRCRAGAAPAEDRVGARGAEQKVVFPPDFPSYP